MRAVYGYNMQRLLFIGLLIALMGGAQAEELINYSEEIGPFVVSCNILSYLPFYRLLNKGIELAL